MSLHDGYLARQAGFSKKKMDGGKTCHVRYVAVIYSTILAFMPTSPAHPSRSLGVTWMVTTGAPETCVLQCIFEHLLKPR